MEVEVQEREDVSRSSVEQRVGAETIAASVYNAEEDGFKPCGAGFWSGC